MRQTLALSSSDGRFDVTVAVEDIDLIASVLLLLEVPRESTVVELEPECDVTELEPVGAEIRTRVARVASACSYARTRPAARAHI